MADSRDNSEASLHTADVETIASQSRDVRPGDCLCAACWALFDGEDLPTCPSCGELRPGDEWASLPYVFLERYEFIEMLGRGGVGAVFRARHVDTARGDQQFAVKVIQQGAHPERRRLLSQMFEREISAAALVGRSRHFVRVLGHDTGDHLHLAMEYVPWPTLKSRLKRDGVMPPREAARLGIALLRAVEVMHAHNIVHRDLKPANVFVTEEDGQVRVKVADLGLWVLSEDRRGDVTESLPAGTFAGTLDYASPEQLDGVGIGLPSDLHAVGSLLWAALTGDVPFPAMGATFVASLHAKRQLVEALPARPNQMPQPLYDVLARALQPRPEERFDSAQAFLTSLENLVQDPEAFSSTIYLRPTVPTPRPRSSPSDSAARRRGDTTPEPAAGPADVSVPEPAPPDRKRRTQWPLYTGAGFVALVLGYFAMSSYLDGGPNPSASPPASVSSRPQTSSVPSPPVPSAEPTATPDIGSLVPGVRHSCAIVGKGTLHCWGANERGQLGDGTNTGRSRPTPVTGLGEVVQAALGDAHTCARKNDSSVWCWGDNEKGQLGDGTRASRAAPRKVPELPPVERLFVGGCQSWAVTREGRAWGWGCNNRGQLGVKRDGALRPRPIPALDGVRRIRHPSYAPGTVACAIFGDRPASCWSWGNEIHQSALDGAEGVSDVAFARDHGCATYEDGAGRCWGLNGSGQVGDGTRERRTRPVDLTNVERVARIVVGRGYGCAREESGRVLCWGRNDRGQLGTPGSEDKLVPAPVPLGSAATAIATDGGRTCAVLKDGRVGCWGRGLPRGDGIVWMGAMRGARTLVTSGRGVLCSLGGPTGAACLGDDSSGQLGSGRSLQRRKPTRVAEIEDVEQVWAASRNACAVDAARRLWCWGSNTWAAFEADAGTQARPVRVGGGVTDVAMGTRGLYAFVEDEEGDRGIRAGGNLLADHGAGASDRLAYPRPVSNLDGATQIAVGVRHGCAVIADGSVSCWGDNTYGQLGDGAGRDRKRPTPALIESNVAQVTSGGFHVCALRESGNVACWGSNRNGQTGPGPTWTCNTGTRVYPCVRRPRRVLGVTGAMQLTSGQWHTCALLTSGSVSCWGANRVGQLGDGSTDERPAPGLVRGISSAVQVAAGEQHTCAVLRSGAVWCWGDNGYGELGRTTEDKCRKTKEPCGLQPGPVAGLSSVTQVAAGWEFSCALRENGTVWCWGNNQRGALGDGEPLEHDTAVAVRW